MASVLDLIGETPLIEITQFDRGPCRLFLKIESANPSGSIKDRPARAIIGAAEADGRLRPGGTIVEATAGNTGLGLGFGRKPQGLPYCARRARQNGAPEDSALQGYGCRSHPDALRRGPWPSRLLSGPR
jgi:cysteine synthase